MHNKKLVKKAQDGQKFGDKFNKTKFGKFLNSDKGQFGLGMLSSLADIVPSMDNTVNEIDSITGGLRNTGQNMMISSGNPLAQLIGIGLKGIDKLGGNSDASNGLGTANDIGNAVASFIPGLGWFAGKTDNYKVSDELASSSGYTGTASDAQKAAGMANSKFIFGRSRANEMIADAKRNDNLVQNILSDASDRINLSANMSNFNSMRYNNIARGINLGYAARKGLKLPTKEQIDLTRKLLIPVQKVDSFKEGGVLQKNVIPEGALHARLHHMEGIDNITKKGIPVVVESEGGQIEQQAEIEREEIIFNLDTTKEIERLSKVYYSDSYSQKEKDNAAIEAGKLLAQQIIENTDDRTGLMQRV